MKDEARASWAVDEFEREVAKPDLDLARACLLVAQDERADLDVDAHVGLIGAWADRVADAELVVGFLDAMRHVLHDEEGLRGSVEDYHDPENSLLDRVMERRRGLPIMLSVIWLEVAARLKRPLVGIGLPAHFVVAHEGTLLDPFRGGRVLTRPEADLIVSRAVGGPVTLTDEMLRPVSDHEILARVLANLKQAWVRAQDAPRAIRVTDRLITLNPYAFPEYRDRGLLKRAVGDVAGAQSDLARYLEGMPTAPDADAVRAVIAEGS